MDKSKEPYSVTVKPYIFSVINVLNRNRRVVVVIERDDGVSVAMVIIGGVTVDSIRMDAAVVEGARISAGSRIGAFARGGSSIAVFYSAPVALMPALQAVADKGMGFKVGVARSLSNVVE